MSGKKLLSLLLSAALVGTMVPTAALAAEDDGAENNPLVCTTDEGCAAESHEENCPLYEMPEEENEELPMLETVLPETAPTEENTVESTPANTEGDKTVPGWVDENDGHPKKIQETFDFVEDNIAYSIVEGGVEVSPWYWEWERHTCSSGHTEYVFCGTEYSNRTTLNIPAQITHNGQSYTVVGIGANAFFEMTGTAVTLPEGITYIGDGAFTFATCESITIPASVTRIGVKALHGGFSSITFAEGSKLESIGDQAFWNCKITELTLPNTVKSLGSKVFSNCEQLTSVVIPASVTEIQTDTFDEYFDADEGQGNVTFAEGSIFKLQDGVLYDPENLIRVLDWQESVAVPEGIKYIGANAFDARFTPAEANTLKSITLPNSLVSIGENAFCNCKALESITIPEKVTELGKSAFSGCTSLKTATIQGPIKELNGTFNGCSSLASVTLPDTLEVVGVRTFASTAITTFDFSNIREIGDYAFNKTKITDFSGATKLTKLGENAFQECKSLKTAVIPSSVADIPVGTFALCNSLETVIAHGGVKSLGVSAFNSAFSGNGGTLVMRSETAPTVGQFAFNMTSTMPENVTVYYPDSAESAYKATILVGEDDDGGYALDLTNASMILTTAKAADGNTLTLKTVTVPEGMTLEAISSNTGVATVTGESGELVVTGVAEGTATITATLKVGDYVVLEDTCTVTVTAEGAVLPSVEEPNVTMDDSISNENDKKVVGATANSVEADKTISDAARSEADKLTNDDTKKAELEQKAKDEGLIPDDGEKVTLYTQTFLDIQATNIDKSDSNISKITLNITPKVQVVASTATNSADIDIKTGSDDEDWNAVVVKEAEALTINTQAAITVQLPTSFAGQPVYVKHEASNGTYFYKATADAQGKITFTSTHGFSPFTFSLTNEAVAEVNGIGYASFQEAVNAAEDGQTVTVFQNKDLTATISGSSKAITVENKTGNQISVSINGETFQIANNATHEYTYTRPSSGGGSSGSTRYTVSVEDTDNGTVKVSPTRASKGSTVTITVTPDEGYELDKLIVTDKNGDKVKLTDKGDGKYTFKMPSSKVTVEATFAEIGTEPETPVFTDVPTSAYYYDAVMWAVENGVTEGTSATTFSPDMACTRAQMVTFLWRAAGSPKSTTTNNPFTDVQSGAYYYDAVLWAVENGVTEGTSATTFSPDAVCTRAQTVTFLWRQAGAPVVNYAMSFTDVDANAYYAEAVRWAVSEGVTEGTSDTTFSPNVDCTRAQIVTFMFRDAQ